MTEAPSHTYAPDANLQRILEELDALNDRRNALAQERSALLKRLLEASGLSRQALMAFLARRRLDEEARAHYDSSFDSLCRRTGLYWQADLFDADGVPHGG